MFWDKAYTPSANIEALLEKKNATVEEFLDDEDILQECKTQKKGIVNYFTRPEVIDRLVEFITTEPSEELPMAQRFRHANMACEILTLGLPSLDEKLLSDPDTLKKLYSYLEKEPPLNPLLSSFFSKTFSMLFTKKSEQDWFLYQQTCLQFLEYIKSQKNFLDLVCKHFSTPVIPDLIMQMMKDVEGGQLKRNLYEWLTEDKLVERLIAILGNSEEIEKHAVVAEFLCDLIQQGRTMRQTEQEHDSFEPAFDGSNPILKTIESECTIEALLNVILEPNAQESAIVSGISVVLTLIKPVVFVDEPNSDRLKLLQNREKDIHEQILTTVIRVIAPRLKEFNELLRNPPNKPDIMTTAAKMAPPFGMTRLQICRVFTVLLQTKNENVSKAICETDFFETLLTLFKQYCWNNFLHSEVEKCLQLIFYTHLSNNNNSTQGSTIVNDGSFGKGSNNGDNNSLFYDFVFKIDGLLDGDGGGGEGVNIDATSTKPDEEPEKPNAPAIDEKTAVAEENATSAVAAAENIETNEATNETESNTKDKTDVIASEAVDVSDVKPNDDATVSQDGDTIENDNTKVPTDHAPSELQKHIILQCKLITKLMECWQHNKEVESAEKGRRLGYMGHLIKIIKHITNCISESEHIGALIESSLSDASELQLWQSIINPTDGDFTKALNTQSKMLANCNAHEASEYGTPKDFLADTNTWDYIMSSNMLNNLGALCDSSANDIVFALEHDMYRNDLLDNNDDNGENDINLFQFGRNPDEDDEEDEDNAAAGDGLSLFGKSSVSTSALQAFGVTNNPWDNLDPFGDMTANSNAIPWATDFNPDNFADFDAHFSSFTNDMGESLNTVANDSNNSHSRSEQLTKMKSGSGERVIEKSGLKPEYDNNANVEKSMASGKFGNSFEDDENAKNEKVATSIVRSLQSVMDDSEDDYEDDEGMWTKPLGGNSTANDDEDDNDAANDCNILTNGPSSKAALENDVTVELSNSLNEAKANDMVNHTQAIIKHTPNSEVTVAVLDDENAAELKVANKTVNNSTTAQTTTPT